jgi:hypothetical protein
MLAWANVGYASQFKPVCAHTQMVEVKVGDWGSPGLIAYHYSNWISLRDHYAQFVDFSHVTSPPTKRKAPALR